MKENRLTAIALTLSMGMHIAIIGASGGFSGRVDKELLQIKAFKIENKQAPLLPEVRIIGELKQFSQASSPKTQDISLSKEVFTQAIDALEPQSVKTDGKEEKAMLRYQDTVKQKIESNRHYPVQAKRMRLEGVVDLAFVIDKDGGSRNVRIIASSGSKFLDEQALNTIRNASPFMSLPKEIGKNSVDIRVAIVFSLN